MEEQCIRRKRIFVKDKICFCTLEVAMTLIGGKWKTMIIYHLKDGAMRSSNLQHRLIGISNKMFTQTLRELEDYDLVERIVYPVVPPKVEYKLTELGLSVLPIILELQQWGNRISDRFEHEE